MLARYMLRRVSVLLSVRLNTGSRKQRPAITQRLEFSDTKDFGDIPTELPTPNGGTI